MRNKFKDYGRRWGIFNKYPNSNIPALPAGRQYPTRMFSFNESTLPQRGPFGVGLWILGFGILVGLLMPQTAVAQCVKSRSASSLQGHARVEWIHKKKIFRYDEAIVIKNPNTATFETIDDFGNTLLKMDFLADSLILMQTGSRQGPISEKKFKKIFSLPLSQSEYINYLLYKVPEGVENLEVNCDKKGRLVSVIKNAKRKKHRYKVSFLDLSRRGRVIYPKTIEIVSKKTILRISWQSVKIYL